MDGKVELIQSRSGKRSIMVGGRLIASCVDPEIEAQNWVQRESSRLARANRVIILGLSAGYHLVELKRSYPKLKVLCLYLEEGLYSQVEAFQSLRGTEFLLIENISQVLDQPLVKSFLRAGADVMTFSSGTALHLEKYQELSARLLARDPLFLADFVRRDERLRKLIPLTAIEGGDNNQLISIKDLEKWATLKKEGSRDLLLVKVLRELVK